MDKIRAQHSNTASIVGSVNEGDLKGKEKKAMTNISVGGPPFVAHAFQLLWGYLTALCWLYLGEKGSSMSGSISECSAYTWMIQPA